MKVIKVIAPTALVLLLALSSSANAVLMAIWDFGPNAAGYALDVSSENVIGTPTMTAGGAEYDTDGGNGVPFADAAGNGHIAGQSLHWRDVSGVASDAEWTITINTTGWEDMAIRWDYKSDATGDKLGPISFDFFHRVGGGGWTEILNDEPIIRDDAWHEFSYDLSSITAIENRSSVQFRVDDLDRGSPDGDYWQDNIELTGVPEPATAVLLGIGGALVTLTRRKGSASVDRNRRNLRS